jgi:dTDP-4-dehydrorhamnose 3,5-epimerase-like enzyme
VATLPQTHSELVSGCRWLDLPTREDARGSLSFAEVGRDVPFDIKRVYYLYAVPDGARRGAHAHKALKQVFIAMSGRFDLHLDDGRAQQTVTLDSPSRALYLPPGLWRDLDAFSPGAVCLVLASHLYDEADYLRDHAAFLAYTKGQT